MRIYQVICVQRRKKHSCIRAVGTIKRERSSPETDPNAKVTKRRKVAQVRKMIAKDHEFFVYGDKTTTTVEPFDCKCGCYKESVQAIRTLRDHTTKDNLDDLRSCNFR
jgi:hypothetical protein